MNSRIPVADAFTNRRVWVSGSRGFLGGRLAEALEGAGAVVRHFAGDLRRREHVVSSIAAARPDVLFHLGATVNVARDPELDASMKAVLYEGSLHVRDALPAGARLVHVGTCEEYGGIDAPYAEDDMPSEPVSPYARWKLATTRELLRRGGDVVVARPFLTYGPAQRPRQLIPAAIRAALRGEEFLMTSGEQTREWNYVDDTVAGLLRCGLEGAPPLVNVCGGPEISVARMVRRVFEAAGAPPSLVRIGAIPKRSGEVARFFGDASRCRDVLGHKPTVSLADGLSRTIAWWKEQT